MCIYKEYGILTQALGRRHFLRRRFLPTAANAESVRAGCFFATRILSRTFWLSAIFNLGSSITA